MPCLRAFKKLVKSSGFDDNERCQNVEPRRSA
jgi:hypothetical protein